MITCSVCNADFPVSSDLGLFTKSIIHETNKSHRFEYKNRKIYLERFIKILIEEEIPPEESGELLIFEDPENIPCYYCGIVFDPCECGFCGVVTCRDCWEDHDDLLINVRHDNDL